MATDDDGGNGVEELNGIFLLSDYCYVNPGKHGY
jgi:hypothetical protein